MAEHQRESRCKVRPRRPAPTPTPTLTPPDPAGAQRDWDWTQERLSPVQAAGARSLAGRAGRGRLTNSAMNYPIDE